MIERLTRRRVVVAPDGRQWVVRRRLRFGLRWRRVDLPDITPWGTVDTVLAAADIDIPSVVVGIAVALLGLALLALLIVLVLPLFALAGELLVLPLLFALGRRFVVVADTVDSPRERLAHEVVGWHRSAAAVEDFADALATGRSGAGLRP